MLKKVKGILLPAKEVLILAPGMKVIIYYIRFLSFLLLYSHHTLAVNTSTESFSVNSFQKNHQQDVIISDESQNLNYFFDNELLDNNDNDPVSTRKKASFRAFAFSSTTPYALVNCFNKIHTKLNCQPNFYPPSFSDFISLRVLRL